MTVWVTGAAGMLGNEVTRALREAGHVVLATDREVDITDSSAVDGYWSRQIDWVLNCAAWTAVDAAETEQAQALRLNATGPEVLARCAQRKGASVLHISTDYVFDGLATRPYLPADQTNPRSVYGKTKLAGEEAVRAHCERHIVVRTAWLYGPAGKNFVSTMLRLMNERSELGVVADQRGLPTYAPDLAAALTAVVGRAGTSGALGNWGTYHYTNAARSGEATTGISWYDFALAIYELGRERGIITNTCTINPLTTSQYPTPAERPAYSVLDSGATVQTFGVIQPDWMAGLRQFIYGIKEPGPK